MTGRVRGPRRAAVAASVVVAMVVVAMVVVANVWAYGTGAQADLSADRRFSLTPETREIIGRVDAPLRISVFLNLEGGTARDARFLLARYRERNRRIDYRLVDPDQQPGEARRLGVTTYATVVLEYRGRRVDAPGVDEVEISSAILRLLRGSSPTVCLTTGHGEWTLDDTSRAGVSDLAELFANNAYETREIDLAGRASVPDACDVVALLGPRVPLLPEEVDALGAYATAGGRLLVAASPLSTTDPNPLLEPWSVRFVGGLVVDARRSEGLDVSNLIVERFPTTNPVVEGVPRLQFPATGGLLADSEPARGITVSELAATSDAGYIESTPDDGIVFDAGADVPGPVLVAAAVDASRIEEGGERRLRTGDAGIVRTRLVVTGNAEWFTNEFLGRLGNRRFMTNALAWLAEEEGVLAAPSRVSTVRPLPWTAERQATVVAVTVVGVPASVLAVGLGVWFVVRRRERPRAATR